MLTLNRAWSSSLRVGRLSNDVPLPRLKSWRWPHCSRPPPPPHHSAAIATKKPPLLSPYFLPLSCHFCFKQQSAVNSPRPLSGSTWRPVIQGTLGCQGPGAPGPTCLCHLHYLTALPEPPFLAALGAWLSRALWDVRGSLACLSHLHYSYLTSIPLSGGTWGPGPWPVIRGTLGYQGGPLPACATCTTALPSLSPPFWRHLGVGYPGHSWMPGGSMGRAWGAARTRRFSFLALSLLRPRRGLQGRGRLALF